MKKYEHVTEQTREKLFKAFWELYKTSDITKITIKNICETANYDRTTFYRYFMDINDILNQFEDEIVNKLKTKIQENTNKSNSTPFSRFKNFSDKYGEYIVVFHNKGNRSFFIKFKELVKSHVYTYLDINIQDEDKKEFLYEFLFSSLIISFVYWYKNPKTMSMESYIKLAHNMATNGSKMIMSYTK